MQPKTGSESRTCCDKDGKRRSERVEWNRFEGRLDGRDPAAQNTIRLVIAFLSARKKIAKHDRSKELLESWLNKMLKIEITDGRVLIGTFLCTDRDLNIILGSCLEYVNEDKGKHWQFASLSFADAAV